MQKTGVNPPDAFCWRPVGSSCEYCAGIPAVILHHLRAVNDEKDIDQVISYVRQIDPRLTSKSRHLKLNLNSVVAASQQKAFIGAVYA